MTQNDEERERSRKTESSADEMVKIEEKKTSITLFQNNKALLKVASYVPTQQLLPDTLMIHF